MNSARPAAGALIALLLLLPATAWVSQLGGNGKPSAAALKREFDSCHAYANIDACYDALRWSPSDPELLMALGDALMHAKRPADAARAYRRAAALAPNMAGLAAKISGAETKRAPPGSVVRLARRYSNAAADAQSH